MSQEAFDAARTCPNCGTVNAGNSAFCSSCGTALSPAAAEATRPVGPPPPVMGPGAVPDPYAGYPPGAYGPLQPVSGKRVTAGVLGILLGAWGVHRFYLGDVLGGILRIVITLATCGIGGVIGLIEGILYLVKTDAEFDQIYLVQRKEWF